MADNRHDLSILRKGGVAAPQDVPPCLRVNGHSEFERLVLLAKGAVSVGSSVSEASTNCVTILRRSCRVGSTSRGAKQGSIVSVRFIANGSAKGQRSDPLDRDRLVGACHQRVATFVEVRTVPWRFPSVLGGVSASRGEWDRVCERPPARAAPLRLKPPQSHPRNHRAWVTAHAPGCAKTRAFNLLVESSSQFGQSEN